MTTLDRGEKYAREAKQELAGLKARIDNLRTKHAEGRKKTAFRPDPVEDIDWDGLFKDLQTRASEIGHQLEDLAKEVKKELSEVDIKELGTKLDDLKKTSGKRLTELQHTGEQRWTEIQTRAETGFWDLRALVQRVGEGVKPLLPGTQADKARYFLQKAPDGRWSWLLDGADAPTHYFANKSEGLKAARRYVRDRRPSELVVRRADGTFEHVHTYRA